MHRKLIWLLMNGIHIGLLYYGLVLGVEGALNVGLFVTWVFGVLSLFLFSDMATDHGTKQKNYKPAMPGWVNVTTDILVIAMLAWYGWLTTAVVWMIHVFAIEYHWKEVKEKKRDIRQ